MKKTKVIALVLCAAIMMMGAGYAAWSETLTINNTVSTGELNVEFLNTAVSDNDPYAGITWSTTSTNANEIDNVSFITTNLYPGASVNLTTTIANTGTLPATLADIIFSDPAIANMTGPNGVALTQIVTDAEKANFFVNGTVSITGLPTVTIPNNTVTLADIDAINAFLPNVLPAGISATMNLRLTLNPSVGDTYENRYINTNMILNFSQPVAP